MVDLAATTDADVERLRGPIVPLRAVGIEQVPRLLREDQTAPLAAKIDGLDKPLVTEMAESVAVDVDLPLRAQTRNVPTAARVRLSWPFSSMA